MKLRCFWPFHLDGLGEEDRLEEGHNERDHPLARFLRPERSSDVYRQEEGEPYRAKAEQVPHEDKPPRQEKLLLLQTQSSYIFNL